MTRLRMILHMRIDSHSGSRTTSANHEWHCFQNTEYLPQDRFLKSLFVLLRVHFPAASGSYLVQMYV